VKEISTITFATAIPEIDSGLATTTAQAGEGTKGHAKNPCLIFPDCITFSDADFVPYSYATVLVRILLCAQKLLKQPNKSKLEFTSSPF
jgi:hypothetical protein